MTKRFFLLAAILIVIEAALSLDSFSQTAKPAWQVEWDRTIELAKKEGKVVISIPAAAELRQALEDGFKKRFAIPVESVPARGAAVTRRIVDESKAGISYFDLHIGGSESIVTGILPENILEPIEPWMILPQVKEPKNWWGGHIWIDNAKRFVYAFQAYQTENLWYNTDLAKPEEIRSFDDLLHPKWQGKIGILDPRTPGSGASLWSYLRDIKGEDYLKKLVAQKLQVGRDQRLLSENLAKGKVSLVMGLTYYSIVPFLKAGLPVKPLPNPREGGVCQRRQRPLDHHQEPAAPQRDQSVRQLAAGQRGTGDLQPIDGPGDAPSRRGYESLERVGRDRGQRSDHAGAVL